MATFNFVAVQDDIDTRKLLEAFIESVTDDLNALRTRPGPPGVPTKTAAQVLADIKAKL